MPLHCKWWLIFLETKASHFREGAPISSRLNAVDLYLVVCIFFVFGKTICTKIKQLVECIYSCSAGVCCNPLAAQEEAEASDEAGAGAQEPPGPGAGHRPRRQEAAHEETRELSRVHSMKQLSWRIVKTNICFLFRYPS